MIRSIIIFLLLFLSVFIFPANAESKVVINEVLNNPTGDETGAEWVELFNLETGPVSLKGCTLSLDNNTTNQRVVFGDEEFIDVFKVISWDGRWLNNSGDEIYFECPDFEDKVIYGELQGAVVGTPENGISFGRNPDGTGTFVILSSITMGQVNSLPPTVTVKPTSTVAPSSKPVSTAKPSPTAKPVAAETLSPTSVFRVSPTYSRESVNDATAGSTLMSEEENSVIPSGKINLIQNTEPESQVLSGKTYKELPFVAVILVILGLTTLAGSFIRLFSKSKKDIIST